MPANEPWSAITHLAAAVLSAAGLALLVTFAAIRATAWHVVGFSVFGASLILLYLASTLYHFFRPGKAKRVFKRIDHAMIYVLIAGTYTPITLTVLRGPWGWTLLGVIWALAATGVSLKSSGVFMPDWLSTSLYVVMGWLAAVALYPITLAIGSGVAWLVLGGVLYTAGAVLYYLGEKGRRRRAWDLHEWFHILVMLGSLSHFWLMWAYVL